jgi:hypothetical protein
MYCGGLIIRAGLGSGKHIPNSVILFGDYSAMTTLKRCARHLYASTMASEKELAS